MAEKERRKKGKKERKREEARCRLRGKLALFLRRCVHGDRGVSIVVVVVEVVVERRRKRKWTRRLVGRRNKNNKERRGLHYYEYCMGDWICGSVNNGTVIVVGMSSMR